MREAFRESIEAISDELVEMTWFAGSAITRASMALLDADLALAERVIAADDHLDQVQRDLEERALELLARQQPVATDLRVIVTSLRISADLERMGDLARHVAKVARLRYPASAVPPVLRGTLLEMAQLAERIVAKASSVIATKDVAQALELERDDDDMDRLHRQLFTVLLAEDWRGGVEQAIDVTLIGRYYERFADHAVSVAHRVVYLVTGEHADGFTL